MDSKLLDAAGRLLGMLFQRLGVSLTLWVTAAVVALLIARRLYLDHRSERHMNRALDEKERTIQRIADQERQWRLYFFTEHGMSREDAERLVEQNEFTTPKESRETLERGRIRT